VHELAVLPNDAHPSVRSLDYEGVKRAADWREEKPAIWLSNHGQDGIIAAYDERVWDRIRCGTCFQLTGKSRRGS
ncbi:MAG: hypothetical protein ACYS8L_08460, partial [Planctomycetota bacterium]|jgi:hypothetical protein